MSFESKFTQDSIIQSGCLYKLTKEYFLYGDNDAFELLNIISSSEFVLILNEIEIFTYRVLTKFGIRKLVLNRFERIECIQHYV